MASALVEQSRWRGARLARRGRGAYGVAGDRWTGAVMAVEAVQADVRVWCEGVTADE